MNVRFVISALIFLVFSTASLAQTLGQATGELLDQVQGQLDALTGPTPSWGESTALDDLTRLRDASASLLNGLESHNVLTVQDSQQELVTAAGRLKASWSLLPGADDTVLDSIQSEVLAIAKRLTAIRSRFDQKAGETMVPLSELSLTAGPEDPFVVYPNPQALLIDVRDTRSLCEQLDYLRYPQNELGRISPNNLDPLQVRRMIQKAWDLQRAVEGRYKNIYAVSKEWTAFKQEYNRMGYPGSTHAARQLDRVVTRLTRFFEGLKNA